jgi:hypothetical protein
MKQVKESTGKYVDGFTKLSKDKALKRYRTKELRDYAFEKQSEAYQVGAAPPVYKKQGERGMIVGLADTKPFLKLTPGYFYNDIFPELHEKLLPIMKDNPFSNPTNGKDGIDLARHNLGIWEGKVVLIDFT